jgi:predicted regulator of Ras-like GTPase activity (Roadblock/LC7/MglB family)
MKTPAPADLHRWSEELARNPASLAFLPLARAYRRLSRRDLALQLCLRGLQHHPNHVEAHALLALLHFEAGERAKAADEWATVLRLKPGNFEALRGMGFRHLEQGDITRARQHLERAALIRPDDTTVQEALRLIRQREAASITRPPAARVAPQAQPRPQRSAAQPQPQRPAAQPQTQRPAAQAQPPVAPPSSRPLPPQPPPIQPAPLTTAPPRDAGFAQVEALEIEPFAGEAGLPELELEPWAEPEPVAEVVAPPTRDAWAEAPPRQQPRRPAASFELVQSGSMPPDPTGAFDSLMGSGPLIGVLLLDRRGLVMAGSMQGQKAGVAEDLGAVIGGAIDEALRAVTHLEMGRWKGLLLECEGAMVHVAPAAGDALLVVAARRDAPTGWIVRTAAHAATLAGPFAEVYS